MKATYEREHLAGIQLTLSLELLRWFALGKAFRTPPISFTLIFLAVAERCTYHATNVWRQWATDLNVRSEFLNELKPDAEMDTSDSVSKFEIEAYLGATKSIFEDNLIGLDCPKKQNLLGRSLGEFPIVSSRLNSTFQAGKDRFWTNANKIRNHRYHLNSNFRDAGYRARICKIGDRFTVTLPHMYVDEAGKPVDLADLFVDTHSFIKPLLIDVRGALLDFISTQHGAPDHATYASREIAGGGIVVGLGPGGWEFGKWGQL